MSVSASIAEINGPQRVEILGYQCSKVGCRDIIRESGWHNEMPVSINARLVNHFSFSIGHSYLKQLPIRVLL